MSNSIKNRTEDNDISTKSPSLLQRVSDELGYWKWRAGSALRGIFTPTPKMRKSQSSRLGIEQLESRLVMSANPVAAEVSFHEDFNAYDEGMYALFGEATFANGMMSSEEGSQIRIDTGLQRQEGETLVSTFVFTIDGKSSAVLHASTAAEITDGEGYRMNVEKHPERGQYQVGSLVRRSDGQDEYLRRDIALPDGAYTLHVRTDDTKTVAVLTKPDGTEEIFEHTSVQIADHQYAYVYGYRGAVIDDLQTQIEGREVVTEQKQASSLPETLYESSAPTSLAAKAPHFVTGYEHVSAEDPITVKAQFTFEQSYSYPSILIAQSSSTDHRNGLREAIYVQIGRSGVGSICQFLGGDNNESSNFSYDELPVGATVDAEVSYDGSTVSMKLLHENTTLVEHTFTPPVSYNNPMFGVSNAKWDSPSVTATLNNMRITRGKDVATTPAETETAVTPEDLDAFFSDSEQVQSLFDAVEAADESDSFSLTYDEMHALRTELDAVNLQIATKGEHFLSPRETFTETFDQLDSTYWTKKSGSSHTANGQLILGGNGMVSLTGGPQRAQGEIRTFSTQVEVSSSDRFLLLVEGSGSVNIDIMTANTNYIGAGGPGGDQRSNGSGKAGTYTIAGTETDSGITFDITDTQGRVHSYAFDRSAISDDATITLYGWKGIRIDSVSVGVGSGKTLGQQRDEITAKLNEHYGTLDQAIAELYGNAEEEQNQPSAEQAGASVVEEENIQTENMAPAVHITGTPEERLQEFAAKQQYLQEQINALELRKADMETEIARSSSNTLLADRDALQEEIHALERQMIPYNRMHVTTENSWEKGSLLHIQYASNRPEAYFEIDVRGSGVVYQTNPHHAGGTENGGFTINLAHKTQNSGAVTITMYSDADKTEVLDRFVGSYDRSRKLHGKTNGDWDDLDTGRIVDTPLQTEISVMRIAGPNILVAVQSPYDSGSLQMEGGGLFSEKNMKTEGGSELTSHILTFNASMESGRYHIGYHEGHNNREISRIEFMWDADTKTITLVGDSKSLSVSEGHEGLHIMENQLRLMDSMVQTSTDEIVVGTVRNALDEHLYTRSNYYINADDAEEYINNFPLRGHPDANVIFHRGLEGWEAAIRETLRDAAGIAVAAWNGESQEAATAKFHETLQRVLTYDYLRRYMLGDSYFNQDFPSANELIAEGKRIAETYPTLFIDAHNSQLKVYRRESYIANMEGPETDPDRSPEAIAQHMQVLAAAHGAGTAGYKNAAANYIASLTGSSNQYVAQNIAQDNGVSVVVTGVVSSTEEVTDGLGRIVVTSVLNDGFGAMTLQEINGESVASITLDQRGVFSFAFSVSEERMVNFWVDGIGMRDVDLEIAGSPLAETYFSNKTGATGESISLVLTPGTYTVTVKDVTNYEGGSMTTGDFPVDLRYSMEQFTSTEIIGRISSSERASTMPVSMRVAEFDKTGRRLEVSENNLDPSRPVWVVVHGKGSSEGDDIMNGLAHALFNNAEDHNFQVVTIDWEQAAKDGIFIQDAPWAISVGQWAAHQLAALGFSSLDVNVVGWSHGSYVAYEMGKELQRTTGSGLNALVALDAAQNIPVLSGYDHAAVNFSDVSRKALAIDSSIIAGSDSLAATADVAFKIQTPESIDLNTFTKHKLAVTAFSATLNKEHDANGPFSNHFSLSHLMGETENNIDYDLNTYDSVFEGIIDVDVDGEQALPHQLHFRNDTGEEEIISFNSRYA